MVRLEIGCDKSLKIGSCSIQILAANRNEKFIQRNFPALFVPRAKSFLAGGVFCDIKKLGTGKGSTKGKKRDLALIVSKTPATVAGMFTTKPDLRRAGESCVERVKGGMAQVVVVNLEMQMPAPAIKAWLTRAKWFRSPSARWNFSKRLGFVGRPGGIGVRCRWKM